MKWDLLVSENSRATKRKITANVHGDSPWGRDHWCAETHTRGTFQKAASRPYTSCWCCWHARTHPPGVLRSYSSLNAFRLRPSRPRPSCWERKNLKICVWNFVAHKYLLRAAMGRTNAAKKRPKIAPPMAALHEPIYVVGERNHPHTTSCSWQTAPCIHTAALSGVLVDFMDMRVRYAVSGNHSPLYTNACKLHAFFFCKVAEHEQMAQLWVCSPKTSSTGQRAWCMRL